MKKGICIIIGLAIILSGCSQVVSKKELFNDNWQFIISEAAFEDIDSITGWESVSLPHTPVIAPKVMDGQWQGTCWYKKNFTIDSKDKDERFILKFDAAMNVSDFWVNGTKMIKHYGGYLPVVFDFTDVVKVGKNTVYVRLDNTDNLVTGPKPMRETDMNMHGGLYRDAYLIRKNDLHITDPILANKVVSGGIFVTYPQVSEKQATVRIQTHVANQGEEEKMFKIENELWKNDRLIASQTSADQTLGVGTDKEVVEEINVVSPELWSPQSPSLYMLKTKLLLNGKVIDQDDTRIGIKHIAFKGLDLYLNGKKIKLMGVDRHQEYPYVGYAISNEANYRDAVKIKEAGFDFIRLSHYPQTESFLNACDELGILLQNSIFGWQYYSKDSLFQNHIYQVTRDLVRRDRNHPSILSCEVSLNESRMEEYFMENLHRIAHEEYPGDQFFTIGWQNYAYDAYQEARQHRLHHYKEPQKPYLIPEYGDWEYYAQNAGLNQDKWGDLKEEQRSSRQLLSDGEVRLLQQVTNIQEAHNDNYNYPAFADAYWDMWDYNRGYANDLEASGIGSIDRIPKFGYYFFQSQRDADEISNLYKSGPMVYIASWWTEESPLNVRVFSNADEVELFLNGKSLGRQKPDKNRISTNLTHPPFTFKIEKFEPGELLAKAYIADKEVATHSVKTPGEPVAIELVIDESGKAPKAGVNDLVFVYASIKDENGTTVRSNGVEVKFKIEGDAEIVNPEAILTEAGIATALVKIGTAKNKITITAESDNLKIAKLSFVPD